MKALLEISRETLRRERRKQSWQTALAALVLPAAAPGVLWHAGTRVHEQREGTIVLKETTGNVNYLHVEEQGHLPRLKCGSGVEFDRIAQTDARGSKPIYRLDDRWNRKTCKGTVSVCEAAELLSLGRLMDATFEAESAHY